MGESRWSFLKRLAAKKFSETMMSLKIRVWTKNFIDFGPLRIK